MEVCSKQSCRNKLDLQARNAMKECHILHTCNMFNVAMMSHDDDDDDVSLLTSLHLVSILQVVAVNYWICFSSLFPSFLVWPLLPDHCRCTGLLLHVITISDTHSVGLLWTSDQPDTWPLLYKLQHSQQADIHAPGCVRTHNPIQRATADPRPRPRGYRDRLLCFSCTFNWSSTILLFEKSWTNTDDSKHRNASIFRSKESRVFWTAEHWIHSYYDLSNR
jgi:hypothetical protein